MEESWADPYTALLEIARIHYGVLPPDTSSQPLQKARLAGYSQYPPETRLLSDEELRVLRAAAQSLHFRVKLCCARGLVLIVPDYRGSAAMIRMWMDERRHWKWLPKESSKAKPCELLKSPSRKAAKNRLTAAASSLRGLLDSISTATCKLPTNDPLLLLQLPQRPLSDREELEQCQICAQQLELIQCKYCGASLCSNCAAIPCALCANKPPNLNCICCESSEISEVYSPCGHSYCEKCWQRVQLLHVCIACTVQFKGNCGVCRAPGLPLLKKCRSTWMCLNCAFNCYLQGPVCTECGQKCSDDLWFLLNRYQCYLNAAKAQLGDMEYVKKTEEKGLFLCENCNEILSAFNYEQSARFGSVLCPMCDYENYPDS